MTEKSEWANHQIREYPFWHDGMTVEEFEIEREHFFTMASQGRIKEYKPLWKQKAK